MKDKPLNKITLYARITGHPGGVKFVYRENLERGELKLPFTNVTGLTPRMWFPNICDVIWTIARSIDKNATIRVEKSNEKYPKMNIWDMYISFNNISILIRSREYNKVGIAYKKTYLIIEFTGKKIDVESFINKIINAIDKNPWEIYDWESFVNMTGITKEEVINGWKSIIQDSI